MTSSILDINDETPGAITDVTQLTKIIAMQYLGTVESYRAILTWMRRYAIEYDGIERKDDGRIVIGLPYSREPQQQRIRPKWWIVMLDGGRPNPEFTILQSKPDYWTIWSLERELQKYSHLRTTPGRRQRDDDDGNDAA